MFAAIDRVPHMGNGAALPYSIYFSALRDAVPHSASFFLYKPHIHKEKSHNKEQSAALRHCAALSKRPKPSSTGGRP